MGHRAHTHTYRPILGDLCRKRAMAEASASRSLLTVSSCLAVRAKEEEKEGCLACRVRGRKRRRTEGGAASAAEAAAVGEEEGKLYSYRFIGERRRRSLLTMAAVMAFVACCPIAQG